MFTLQPELIKCYLWNRTVQRQRRRIVLFAIFFFLTFSLLTLLRTNTPINWVQVYPMLLFYFFFLSLLCGFLFIYLLSLSSLTFFSISLVIILCIYFMHFNNLVAKIVNASNIWFCNVNPCLIINSAFHSLFIRCFILFPLYVFILQIYFVVASSFVVTLFRPCNIPSYIIRNE